MLTKRDKAILADLKRFRVMDRDSIAEIHFGGLKCPKTAANAVLLRLYRDGHVRRSTLVLPYLYFAGDSTVKETSAKIQHWLAILNVYKDVRQYGAVEQFVVEPNLGAKGTVEPDVFMVFRKTPFFIEVQTTVYSEKQMRRKFDRYADFQRQYVGKFPQVIVITDQQYSLTGYNFRIFQAESFSAFMERLKSNRLQASGQS